MALKLEVFRELENVVLDEYGKNKTAIKCTKCSDYWMYRKEQDASK